MKGLMLVMLFALAGSSGTTSWADSAQWAGPVTPEDAGVYYTLHIEGARFEAFSGCYWNTPCVAQARTDQEAGIDQHDPSLTHSPPYAFSVLVQSGHVSLGYHTCFDRKDIQVGGTATMCGLTVTLASVPAAKSK